MVKKQIGAAALNFKPQPAEGAGKAAALRALPFRALNPNKAVPLTTTAEFTGFTSDYGKALALIENGFMTDDTFAFVSIIGAAKSAGNRSGVFVQIVHDIEPSGR